MKTNAHRNMPYEESNQSPWKSAAILILLAAAFILATEGWERVRQRQEIARGVEQAKAKIDALRDKAAREHPNEDPVTAMQTVAAEEATKRIKDLSGANKVASAASSFLGFYLMNVKGREEYCSQFAVNLSRWLAAFQSANAAPYLKARAVYESHRYPISKAEETLYTSLHLEILRFVEEDMNTVARTNGLSTKGACELLNSHADELANNVQFSKILPVANRALMESK